MKQYTVRGRVGTPSHIKNVFFVKRISGFKLLTIFTEAGP